MNEYIASIVTLDEAIPFLLVEPLHYAACQLLHSFKKMNREGPETNQGGGNMRQPPPWAVPDRLWAAGALAQSEL